MNDFTKDELELILDYIKCIRYLYPSSHHEFHQQLLHKTQRMIKNYCEHEKDVWPLYTSTGDIACAGLCFSCNKCVDKNFISN